MCLCMTNTPYSQYNASELILRDHLAIDRTVLANERTMLAYIRTAAILFGGAVTLIKFFPEQKMIHVLGIIFTLLAIVMLVIGWARYSKLRSALKKVQNTSIPRRG